MNYRPVDPDCTKEGVTCHFYVRKPDFCLKGLNEPWRHCCTCGGGSTFNGTKPQGANAVKKEPEHVVNISKSLGFRIPGMDKISQKLTGWEHKAAEALKPVKTAVHEVYAGINADTYDKPPELEGSDVEDINRDVDLIVVAVGGATLLAGLLDVFCTCRLVEDRPKFWSLALLVASYALLIPGLSGILFSFDVVVDVLGHRVDIQPQQGHKSCTESVTGLVHLLYTTGSRRGAVLVALYAMVIPGVKMAMLLLGELLRNASNPYLVSLARFFIFSVQHISKWASPDMFAYILLVHLVRVLMHEPIILTSARLDTGFSCFSAFCVCSTISSLGIPLPQVPSPISSGSRSGACVADSRPPLLLCVIGKRGVVWFAGVLLVAFLGLFVVGLRWPCMALRIDEGRLYPPYGQVPYSAKPVIEAMAIPDLMSSDVSLWACMQHLLLEIRDGEANSVFALVMFAVFVVGLTVTDMLCLFLSALRLRLHAAGLLGPSQVEAPAPLAASKAPEGGSGRLAFASFTSALRRLGGQSASREEPVKPTRPPRAAPLGPCPFLAVARVVRKLSMLDVAIMGVWVVTFCLSIYKKDGIIVSTRPGLLVLLGAEAVHTVAYCAISGAVGYATEPTSYEEAEMEELLDGGISPRVQGCSCISTRRLQLYKPFALG